MTSTPHFPGNSQDLGALLLTALQFEHWLRYFFLPPADDTDAKDTETEENSPEYLAFPPEWEACIQKDCPHLAPLAHILTSQPISLDYARQTVFSFVQQQAGMDEKTFQSILPNLVDDPIFRRNLDAFHGFVEAESEAEYANGPKAPVSFTEWLKENEAWAKENANLRVTTIPVYEKPAE